jgi:hypothetical protein
MSLIHEAGFQGSAAQTMYAIVMAESGANTTAHNNKRPDDSYGLAQVNMIDSLGPQRMQQFGLKSATDLFDPLTNLKVAYALSNGGTNFSPWTTYTSGKYQQYMGQTGAQVHSSGAGWGGGGGSGGGSSGGGFGGGGSASGGPNLTADDFASISGLGNLLSSIPDLHKLIQEAVAKNWSSTTFQNEVENTTWYKTHSDTVRSILIQQANDPAAYHQRWSNAAHSIVDLAHQLGFAVDGAQAQAIATNALLTGHETDQAWLTHQLSNRENYAHVSDTGNLTGQMAAAVQQLQGFASDYGIQYTPAQLAEQAQAVVSGNTTIDTYKNRMVSWAASTFPSLAKEIQGGATVKSLAQPYMQSMSNLLEVDPGTLNLYTPAIRKAMQGTADPSTGQRTSTPLWQFEDQVRQDPRWQYTQNAKDTASTALVKLGADFGFGPQG